MRRSGVRFISPAPSQQRKPCYLFGSRVFVFGLRSRYVAPSPGFGTVRRSSAPAKNRCSSRAGSGADGGAGFNGQACHLTHCPEYLQHFHIQAQGDLGFAATALRSSTAHQGRRTCSPSVSVNGHALQLARAAALVAEFCDAQGAACSPGSQCACPQYSSASRPSSVSSTCAPTGSSTLVATWP